jgi:NAD(P)-dependent dehydrogenase (short-subunit alcohol dehydrogenase family)
MPTNTKWNIDDIPNLDDKTVIVTGANSGLGYETSKALAAKGSQVIMACRNMEKAETAASEIRREVSNAKLAVMKLDLASLAQIREFADAFTRQYQGLHILCNNAGVMATPYRTTADGFELQLGTNHLGHFALTGLLLDMLLQTGAGRVVTVSSNSHTMGQINFDDLQRQKAYRKWEAYGQSKLANLLFAYELQRKLEAAGADVISVAAHPGYAATNLQLVGPQMAGSVFQEKMMALMNRLFAQDQAMGALPTLYAATSSDVQGGDYIGPDGFMERRGHPTKVRSNEESYDEAVATALWAVSEELTGVRYKI